MIVNNVVISGLGIISPIGNGLKEFWKNLIKGACGIDRIKGFDTEGLPTRIAAEIRGFDPLEYVDAKTAKRLTRTTQLALASVTQAISDAGISITDENRHRIGIYFGSSLCSLGDFEGTIKTAHNEGWRTIPFMSSVQEGNHAAASNIACHFKISGPAMTLSSACNSSGNAMEIAVDQIRLGKIDLAVVAGADVLSETAFKSFCKTKSMSRLNDSPAEASRPYDMDRDGFVAAEGAAAAVLEPKSAAKNRSANIYAEVSGCATNNDSFNLIRCEPGGKEMSRAMIGALKSADVDRVDYISAHAPSIPEMDRIETLAIKRAFNGAAYNLQISSIKGAIGSPLGATNMIQTVASCLSLRDSVIPPTINLKTPDPACDLDCVPNEARSATLEKVLVNSHGYGGGNTSILLKSV